jgi:hypothetical protein
VRLVAADFQGHQNDLLRVRTSRISPCGNWQSQG